MQKKFVFLRNSFFNNRFPCQANLILFVTFLFIFLIPSCGEQTPSKNDLLYEQRNGLIYLQGSDKPFTGTINDTLNNKIIRYDVVEGIKDGEFKIFYLNGQLEMAGSIVEGKNEGKWQYFYPDGKLESEGFFENDLPNGKWIWYYESGIKKEEGLFVDGNKEGKWIQYDKKGEIITEKIFEAGIEIKK